MNKVKTYRDLIVWQKAHALAKKIIETTKDFPQTEEARIAEKSEVRISPIVIMELQYLYETGRTIRKFR